MAYAVNTSVPVGRTREEIQHILEKYGATGFAFAEQGIKAMIVFEMHNRRLRFVLPLPIKPIEPASRVSQDRYAQSCRSAWRALLLAIKAKLECVESRIGTFEDEFLSHIVLPSGQTTGEMMKPQIQAAYATGKMPPLLGYDR